MPRLLNLLAPLVLLVLVAAAGLTAWIAASRYSISPMFGPISGFLAVSAVVVALSWVALSRSRPLPSLSMAGDVECPRCASLQTDRDEAPTDGSSPVMRCFACEHRFE